MAILQFSALLLAGLAAATSSSKRGLVFTPNATFPQDNKIWIKDGSDLTWYYNYGSRPSPIYASLPQDKFEFIPMMWGLGPDPNATTWLDEVKDVINQGTKINHALAFNEPDAPGDWGGSNIDPHRAAMAWVANFEPLAKMGIKLGLPAVTGAPSGFEWLKSFLGNCSQIVSQDGPKKNCTWDFVPVHWYDNLGGLKSHISERHAEWPDKKVWVTEYALAHNDLGPTQDFYTQSADYLDNLDYLERYSYFGAFRAENANVGPNAAFLNNAGSLTDIGSWYLGFGSTGVTPESTSIAALLQPQGTIGHVVIGAAAAAGVMMGVF